MYSSSLPNAKVTAEENSSTYYPSGMLDRDQRTTFRIEKPGKNSIPSSRLSHKTGNQESSSATHCKHNHHQNNSTAIINERCKDVSQTEDNSQAVMCLLTKNLQKHDFNQSRIKFPVALQVAAWFIFFAVNITYSTAGPIPSMPNACDANFNETIINNRKQTNFSIENLNTYFESFKKTTKTPDDYVAHWIHLAGNRSETKIEALFEDGKPELKEVLKKNLQLMYDDLFDVAEHFKFFHCMHTNIEYTRQTLHAMHLNSTENNDIIFYFGEIFNYTIQNILQIQDASRQFGLNLNFPEIVENCNLHNSTNVVLEIVTMKKLNETLQFMSGFFDYIDQKFC